MKKNYTWKNGTRVYRNRENRKYFVIADCPPRQADCYSIGFDTPKDARAYKAELDALKTPDVSYWEIHKLEKFNGKNGF